MCGPIALVVRAACALDEGYTRSLTDPAMPCAALRLPLAFLMTLTLHVSASALSLPFEEHTYLPPEETTTYQERSLNRQAPLTIEHPPTVRYRDRAAIAGFCRDGGFVRRRDVDGAPVILRQREVCENVAPRQLNPGSVDPRPVWPYRGYSRQRALTTKG